MDIRLLDPESLMAVITLHTQFHGKAVTHLHQEISDLKTKGAMAFIFDLSRTSFLGTSALSFLSILGAEAVMGNDKLRVICTNKKFILHFELAGLMKSIKIMDSLDNAIEELKNVLMIDDLLPEPQVYKTIPINEDEGGSSSSQPLPETDAKPTEKLPPVFEVAETLPKNVSYPYLVPPTHLSQDAVVKELRHLSVKMKESYQPLEKKVSEILLLSDETNRSQRSYPVREWARTFSVTQGHPPKQRHLLFSVGALVHKKAKTLSYSKDTALDEFEFDCYFSLAILEPCELYGEPIHQIEANGWTYHQYSSREPEVQSLALKLIDPVLQFVKS